MSKYVIRRKKKINERNKTMFGTVSEEIGLYIIYPTNCINSVAVHSSVVSSYKVNLCLRISMSGSRD